MRCPVKKRSRNLWRKNCCLSKRRIAYAGEIHDNVTQNIFGLVYGLDILIKEDLVGLSLTSSGSCREDSPEKASRDLSIIYCMSHLQK